MKYLKYIMPIVLLIVIGIVIILSLNNNKKFYLEDKYYSVGEFIDITNDELTDIIDNDENFLLYTYNNYCSLPIPCDSIFESVMNEYGLNILQIKFSDFKETDLYKKVKLAPSILIFKDGMLIDYLDAESDDDLEKYQDKDAFKDWISKYIKLEQ